MTSTDIGKSIDRNTIIKAGFVLALIIFLVIVYKSGSAKDIDLAVISDRLENDMGIEKEMKKASDRDVMEFLDLIQEALSRWCITGIPGSLPLRSF